MKQGVILLLMVGLASIIGGCSWVSKLTNSSLSSEQALPQAKTNAATIDFYAIDPDDFPSEKEKLLQEMKKLLEEVHKAWLGHPINIVKIDMPVLSSDLALARPLATIPVKPSVASAAFKTAFEAIIAKAKNNKEKYLVASINANSITPAELCAAYKATIRSRLYYIDTQGNEILRQEVNKLLKSCY